VLGGRSIEKLREIIGHSTVMVTERYSHLEVGLFPDGMLAPLRRPSTRGR
jgi:hypothetical protein